MPDLAPQRAPIVAAAQLQRHRLEPLIRLLTVLVAWTAPARSNLGFVVDQVRARTRVDDPTRPPTVDELDEHFRTAVRDRVPLAEAEQDTLVARLVALGRPRALALQHGRWGALPDGELVGEVLADSRRMTTARQVLDEQGVELVRRAR